jgi:hypothetical protein
LSIGQARAQQSSDNADARWAEVFASSKAIEARYEVPTSYGGQPDSAFDYGMFLSEDRDIVGTAGLLMGSTLNFGWTPLEIRFGPRAYVGLLSERNTDVVALSIGLQARYEIVRSHNLAIAAHAFFAPDILTFGSADQISDVMVRGEIGVTDRLVAFGGYRWFHMALTDQPSRDLQNQIFAGVRWKVH